MPAGVLKQTAKIFVMRVADDIDTYRQVTVQGSALTYDPATGQITGGTVNSIRYDIIDDNGVTRTVVDSTSWSGLNSTASVLATAVGTQFWNSVAALTTSFTTLDTLNPGVVRSNYDATSSSLIGTNAAERLLGSVRADAIDGLNGNDTIYGRQGDDTLSGGAGTDRLLGGVGNDVLTDAAGTANTFSGGAGNDTIIGGAGNDQMSGDIGNDTFDGNGGLDAASGGAGVDTFVFDTTDQGTLRITGFSAADDLLFNEQTTSAAVAYANFMANAVQAGSHVQYTDGDQTITLLRVRLADLDVDNFVGTVTPPEVLV